MNRKQVTPMARTPANLKVIVAAGVPISKAIAAVLPGTSAEFAERHDFFPAHVSTCIRGKVRHERIRAALATELGVDREWLDEQLDAQREAEQSTPEAIPA